MTRLGPNWDSQLAKARIRRSGGDQFGLSGQKRRGSGAVEPCLATRRHQLKYVAVLLPTSGRNAEHPLDKSAARFAVGSAAALVPWHVVSQRALDVVVPPLRLAIPVIHLVRFPSSDRRFQIFDRFVEHQQRVPAILTLEHFAEASDSGHQ